MSAFYSNTVQELLINDSDAIIGKLTSKASDAGFYQQLHSQTKSWENFISLLKTKLLSLTEVLDFQQSSILLEYPIPRREKRIDCVLLLNDIIIVIEFKDNENEYRLADKVQLEDYCLDLRDFHLQSKDRTIVPILLSTSANNYSNLFRDSEDNVKEIVLANSNTFSDCLIQSIRKYSSTGLQISLTIWDTSSYSPTPTIIEAAQSLYSGKSVQEISRSHAGAENLTKTTDAVIKQIALAQQNNSKVICFITGVPGAGKTLAGLNIVHNKIFSESGNELGVFLSGNGPLVKVLTEALARDFARRTESSKEEARREVKTFIQNVHRFVEEYHANDKVPIDKVVIFDEAQRAWDAEQSNRKFERDYSEAEMMFNIMDRHPGWAVIVALVGGGQEINNGEAGLPEWGKAITEKFSHWKVCISKELKEGDHSTGNLTLFQNVPAYLNVEEVEDLHLRVSIRAFRAQELSRFVSLLLENKSEDAKSILNQELQNYPLFITRSLDSTKKWLRSKQRGSRRIGLVATSGARRLRPFGLDVKAELEVAEWFLNPSNDVRSSFTLEVPATEFGIQGLELDWVGLCWDGDLRRDKGEWDYKRFLGTSWVHARQEQKQKFIVNKYRVLMTRAREGMIIWVPIGDKDDGTRDPKFYDDIYDYLKSCGIPDFFHDPHPL